MRKTDFSASLIASLLTIILALVSPGLPLRGERVGYLTEIVISDNTTQQVKCLHLFCSERFGSSLAFQWVARFHHARAKVWFKLARFTRGLIKSALTEIFSPDKSSLKAPEPFGQIV